MADRIREKETVVVDEEDTRPVDRNTNPFGAILLILLGLLVLALLFAWFGNGGADDTETTNPVEQETQVEVPAGGTETPTDTQETDEAEPNTGGTGADQPTTDETSPNPAQ